MSSFDPDVPSPVPAPLDPTPAPPWALPAELPPPLVPRPWPLHPNFWWGVLWCIGLLLFTQIPGGVVAVLILIAGVVLLPSGKALDLGNTEQVLASPLGQVALGAGLVTAHLLIIVLSLVVLRILAGRDWPRQVALRLPSLTHVALTVACLPAFMILANGTYHLLRDVLQLPSFLNLMGRGGGMEEMEKAFGAWPLFLGVFIIGLMPGVSEELWCRAFLGRGLVGRHGYLLGVLGTSFLFGAIHVDPCQGGMAAVLGVVLHFVYLTSRSLLVPMLLHFLNNGLAVALTRVPEVAQISSGPAPWYLYVTAGLLLAAVGLAFYQGRARLVAGGEPAWQPAYPGVACPPAGSATRIETPVPPVVTLVLVVVALGGLLGAVAVAIRGVA